MNKVHKSQLIYENASRPLRGQSVRWVHQVGVLQIKLLLRFADLADFGTAGNR